MTEITERSKIDREIDSMGGFVLSRIRDNHGLEQVNLLKKFFFSQTFTALKNYDAHYYDDDYQLILDMFEAELIDSCV